MPERDSRVYEGRNLKSEGSFNSPIYLSTTLGFFFEKTESIRRHIYQKVCVVNVFSNMETYLKKKDQLDLPSRRKT